MYTAFYGLREKPFSLTPNPRFLYLAESHREALAHLLYGLEQGEGFIVVSGEVGTGKTTICRTLLERLGAETELAFLFNPSGSGDEMLQSVNEEFGLPAQGLSRRELLSQLNRFLLDKNRESKRVVLIIDEAQNLSTTTLEQVRLLSNLETTSSKLIQIILLGQPELAEKLDSPELRQLRQRIGVRWQLSPLSAAETAEYVKHRLRVSAGAERGGLFSDAALKEMHRRTGGVPRLVNVLCDRALLAGYAVEAHSVGVDLVKQAAQEIRDLRDGAFAARERRSARTTRPRWWFASGAAALVALALVGGLWLGSGRAGDAVRGWLDGVVAAPPPVSAPPAPPAATRPPADPSTIESPLPPVSSRGPGLVNPAENDMAEDSGWPSGWEIDTGDEPDASEGASAQGRERNAAPGAGMPASQPNQSSQPEQADQTRQPSKTDQAGQTRQPSKTDQADPERQADPTSAPSEVAALARAGRTLAPVSDNAASSPPSDGDGSFLAHLLTQVSPAASRRMAVAEILGAWGRPAPAAPFRSDAAAIAAIREAGLQVHGMRATGLDELARLDHPTLIALKDARGQTHWVALTELRPSDAFVAGVVDRGAIGVSHTALERRWDDGWAMVVWSSEIGLSDEGVLRAGSVGASVRWVQDALVELGYLAGLAIERPAVYDMPTRRGIERFQRAQGLHQDGITGPLTLMRLDDALGRSERPRLDRGEAG